MPKIPQYDEPQVQPRALPGVRQESVATPSLLGGAADSLAQLSSGALTAGTGLDAIAVKMQERDDMQALLAAEAMDKEASIALEAGIRQNYQGDKAKGVTQRVKDWWDERMRKTRDSLQTDNQREVYVKRITAHRLQSLHSTSQFEVNQGEVALDQSARAAVVSATNAAAADPSETNIAIQKAAITKINAALARRRGWAEGKDGKPGVLDTANQEDITRLHKQVVDALVASDNPAEAAAYFERHKDEIAGGQRDTISKTAQQASANARGRAAADEIFARLGPDAGVDAMVAEASKMFPKDIYAFDAATARIKDKVTVFNHGEDTRLNAIAAKVNQALLAGNKWSSVSAMPEYIQLATQYGEKGAVLARSIRNGEEQRMATLESRAATAESRAYTRAAHQQLDLQRRGLDTWLGLMGNPDALASLTTDQIINMRPVMSDQQLTSLMSAHTQLTKSAEALAAARIDNDTFRALAIGANLHPDKKGMSEEDKDRLVLLRSNVDARLSLAARTKGRPLNPEERATEAKKAFDDTVRVPGFFSIRGYGTGADLPVNALTPDELRKAVVQTSKGYVRLSEIPSEFVDYAEAQRRIAGRIGAMSQKTLAEAWVLNKDTWRPRAPSAAGRFR